MKSRKPIDHLKSLRDLTDALNHAEVMEKILDDVWQWHGPYGPLSHSTPKGLSPAAMERVRIKIANDAELRAVFEAVQMPSDIHDRLRSFFDFDDSE